MKWKKLGHIFTAERQNQLLFSHASNPVFREDESGNCYIYFSSRDREGKSHIFSMKVEFQNDESITILQLNENPLLSPGADGLFDDSGVVMADIINFRGKLYLYYLGWNLKLTVPWLNTIGLAIWDESTQNFEKYSRAPIMDRSEIDPYTISYPSVLEEKGRLHMWYGSNLSWGKDEKSMKHVFKYASSEDGIHWNRTGQIVLDHIYPGEYALSKPWVIKENGIYKMWYSYRGKNDITSYRIGYAESEDGLRWQRKDEQVGIDVSDEGWDSQMISYPCVFDHNDGRYMLYNGNHYGKSGFGISKLMR